jgi:hypothetical protein
MASRAAGSVATGTSDSVATTSSGGARDERISKLYDSLEILRAELPDDQQRRVVDIVVAAYERIVFRPTRKPWRDEEFELLERELERTSLRQLAEQVKKELDKDAEIGGCWHAIFGRSFASFVTHERGRFMHFKMCDAHVMVWQHGL